MMDYYLQRKEYKLWDIESNKFIISVDVTFQEVYTPISPHTKIITPIIEQEDSGSYLGIEDRQ